MPVLVIDCPHCPTKNSRFSVHNLLAKQNSDLKILFGTCSACNNPISALINASASVQTLNAYIGDLAKYSSSIKIDIFPKRGEINIPLHVPENVKGSFLEAIKAKEAGIYNAACAMYRRTLELSLKAYSPEASGSLYNRIKALRDSHEITPALCDLADGLRLETNASVHEEDATKEIAEQMHEFCKYFLLYLFTMPQEVALARARRGS